MNFILVVGNNAALVIGKNVLEIHFKRLTHYDSIWEGLPVVSLSATYRYRILVADTESW